MTDLSENSLLELMKAIRAPVLASRPGQLVVSEEALAHMKALCADDAEFRKRVIAEFPQLEGVV